MDFHLHHKYLLSTYHAPSPALEIAVSKADRVLLSWSLSSSLCMLSGGDVTSNGGKVKNSWLLQWFVAPLGATAHVGIHHTAVVFKCHGRATRTKNV